MGDLRDLDREPDFTLPVSIRFRPSLYRLITGYARVQGISNGQALRDLLVVGNAVWMEQQAGKRFWIEEKGELSAIEFHFPGPEESE
jgi:hypothetical protein